MARKLRVEYPGGVFHVMNRRDRREDIFRGDQYRERVLETVAEVCAKTSPQLQLLYLMGDLLIWWERRRRPTFALIRLIARLSL
jgi:hypothetical protein